MKRTARVFFVCSLLITQAPAWSMTNPKMTLQAAPLVTCHQATNTFPLKELPKDILFVLLDYLPLADCTSLLEVDPTRGLLYKEYFFGIHLLKREISLIQRWYDYARLHVPKASLEIPITLAPTVNYYQKNIFLKRLGQHLYTTVKERYKSNVEPPPCHAYCTGLIATLLIMYNGHSYTQDTLNNLHHTYQSFEVPRITPYTPANYNQFMRGVRDAMLSLEWSNNTQTTLHYAGRYGHLPALALVIHSIEYQNELTKDQYINLQDQYGKTAFDYARAHRHTVAAEFLRFHGAVGVIEHSGQQS